MSLFAQLLDALDGESLVYGDAATVRLEAALANVPLTTELRSELRTQISELRHEMSAEVRKREPLRMELWQRRTKWMRAAESTTNEVLAAQAKERAEQTSVDVLALTAEIAEYEATILRLDEISTFLDRTDADEVVPQAGARAP